MLPAGGKPLGKKLDSAIKSFSSAAERKPVINYLAYSYRKAGKLDLAFKHYNQALALDLRHRGAHEYIGEAYLIRGDMKSAQKHLAAITRIQIPLRAKDMGLANDRALRKLTGLEKRMQAQSLQAVGHFVRQARGDHKYSRPGIGVYVLACGQLETSEHQCLKNVT